MATVTGLTSERMLAIEASSVIDGDVDVNGNLILTKHDGTPINAGSVIGPQGPRGLDAAPGSVSPTPNTTPIRTTDSRVKGANPTEPDDLTPKGYIDTVLTPLASKTYVDDAFAARPRIATGSYVNATVVGSGVGISVTQTFPVGLFTTPPRVVITPTSSTRLSCAATLVTKDGFTARLDNYTPAGASDRNFNWIAIEEVS